MKAKIVEDVCESAVAETAIAINAKECFKSILDTDQKTRTRNDWAITEGQWPHKNPVETGKEKINREKGKDKIATFLLKPLTTKYIIKAAIIVRNTVTK